MKARCIRLIDSFGNSQEKSAWLTVGKSYHVLEVVQDQGRWLLRIVADESNGVALFQLEQFEIETSKIPPSWIIFWGKEGFFGLTPEPWSHAGFWEHYYDQNPGSLQIFEEEKRKIIEADP
jgi:hypothetical protein